ncbi:ABC transporter permease [Microbacterium resistens]|nr:ABC transporter permease [Microbacterium resistens]
MLAAGWLALLVVVAATADLLPLSEGRDPSRTLSVVAMAPPTLIGAHPLGTDALGLDILAQLIYGARVSITVAVGATALALLLGAMLGMTAGYARGPVDQIIGFVTDVLLSFPGLILLLAMATFLRPNTANVTVALGILALPGYVRLARSNTLAIASREFVTASRALGAGAVRILVRGVLPHLVPTLLSYGFLAMSFLIVAEASLSYLGLGIQRPDPTWGNLIATGQAHLETHPGLVAIPAAALFLTVASANALGQWLSSRRGPA